MSPQFKKIWDRLASDRSKPVTECSKHPKGTTIEEGTELAAWNAEVADGINCRAEKHGHRMGKGATVPLVEAIKKKVKNIPVWTACRLLIPADFLILIIRTFSLRHFLTVLRAAVK